MKIKACPYCETTIAINESDNIPDFCPKCKKELNPKELLTLDIKDTTGYIKPTNSVASILKVLGWIIIVLGIAIGIFEGKAGLIIGFSGLISGIMMLGFSEIINLLHQINLK